MADLPSYQVLDRTALPCRQREIRRHHRLENGAARRIHGESERLTSFSRRKNSNDRLCSKWSRRNAAEAVARSVGLSCNDFVRSDRLQHGLTNLIGNAAKFTESGHVVVRVKCMQSDNSSVAGLRIEVHHSGIGNPVGPACQPVSTF